MRRLFFRVLATLLLSGGAIGQSASSGRAGSSDSPTLQALLSEVRALRQELRASLNRTQSAQILLARFQIQEGVTTRAADRLNEAREKLLDVQTHQKELALEQKRLEDSPPAADPQQQSDLLDRLNHVKSDLEVAGHTAKQHQTVEIQAAQRLQEEQDKLNALENQLDELTGSTANSNGNPADNRP
jgi:chromosome segregation ATPase